MLRNQMFNQYVERGGIKGLHVQDRLLDSSIFNNNVTINNSDIPQEQLHKKSIEDIPTGVTNNKKSILKNKVESANCDGRKREDKKNGKSSARSSRSRSNKSRER